MGISDRLGNLRQLLPGAGKPSEEERLLQLYWNRAGLKKEFSRLQDERYALLEKLKKQESAALRVQEQVEQLEEHLGDPAMGPQSLVYFQLKALWRQCGSKLALFADELRTQQESRERRVQLTEFDQNKQRQLDSVDGRLLEAQSAAATLENQFNTLENKQRALRGFWNYFKRRKLAGQLMEKRAQLDAALTVLTDISDERAQVEGIPTPEFPGISTSGRRMVNTSTIAYAQQLVSQLTQGGLALLARETTAKRIFDVHYGSREQCAKLMAISAQALAWLAQDQMDLEALKARTDALRSAAVYRNDMDTIPLTDSIGVLPVPSAFVSDLDAGNRSGINVLVDDYWDLYKALLQ